ncbi:MAG: hypothetical protein WCQ60_02790 [bacterium]
MKNNIKKLVSAFLILSIVTVTSGMAIVPKAQAEIPVSDFSVISILSATLPVTTSSTGLTASITSALGIKTLTLDKITTAIAKQILMQLTLSVVNWINSGFQGSPSFVQNPAGFFQDIGDRIAGSFLQANGDLRFLCSPFSLDIRIALAVKMQGQIAQKYTCTLSSAIKNAKNAVKGASITGFIQGDFSQGGFPAFLTLTTDPQNNAGGAFLQAEQDLTEKINKQVNQKVNELAQGHGFLSWEDCKYSTKDSKTGEVTPVSESDYKAAASISASEPAAMGIQSACTTQTPGDVISATLNEHLAVPTRELELANDINAVINALFSQLVLQVLKLGLGAVSGGSGSSAGNAYLQQLAASSQQQNQTVIDSTAQSVASYAAPAEQIKANKDAALISIASTKNDFTTGIDCWTKILPNDPTVGDNILALQQTITNQIAPLEAQAMSEDSTAAATLKSITDIQDSIASSQDVTKLGDPAQQLQTLATSNSIPSPTDVLNSQTALDALNKKLDTIDKSALASLKSCQMYVLPVTTP